MDWGYIRKTALFVCALGHAVAAGAQSLGGGVNLSGAEFNASQLPGSYGADYIYPSPAEVDYYLDHGMTVLRIPFRWERLQHSLYAALDGSELARLQSVVAYATGQGAYVILDPHNYARYYGSVVGSSAVPNAAFADFWSRLATQYQSNPRVIFGLMNEPHDMPTEQWVSAANAAISAIRSAGASNLILVPGNGWSGSYSWYYNWYGTPNAEAMLNIADPAHHFAFEVHLYFDADNSGSTPEVVSTTIGSEKIADFTQWLRQHGYQGLLGEFAVAGQTIGTASSQIGDEALRDLLDTIENNADVWLGWTWWAGGPWLGEYMFTLEPQNLGQANETDRPQIPVLEPYLMPEPGSALWPGIAAVALLDLRRRRRLSSARCSAPRHP